MSHRFAPPGYADELSAKVVARWNEEIAQSYGQQSPKLKSRFFQMDPSHFVDAISTDAVKWPGDPAEPTFCINVETARSLSDWGIRGRHALHNEYCEYVVVHGRDATGRSRPKRVEVTTELREYWLTVAVQDPDSVKSMASETLGIEVSWSDLYGVPDPHVLSPRARRRAFAHVCAGHGNDQSLIDEGVPVQPTGWLNTERALFMTHPINGLDDLLYIVMFGAAPFAVAENGMRRPATRDDIFRAHGVEHLACRHADPAAAMGAYDAVLSGKSVGFADPLGMYLREPNSDVFSYHDSAIPEEWVNMGRGREGMYQRLVVGPPDDEDIFLDDIVISIGAADSPLSGGHQIVSQVDVGPLIMVADTEPIAEDEWQLIPPASKDITCADANVCSTIRALADAYAAQDPTRVAPRQT